MLKQTQSPIKEDIKLDTSTQVSNLPQQLMTLSGLKPIANLMTFQQMDNNFALRQKFESLKLLDPKINGNSQINQANQSIFLVPQNDASLIGSECQIPSKISQKIKIIQDKVANLKKTEKHDENKQQDKQIDRKKQDKQNQQVYNSQQNSMVQRTQKNKDTHKDSGYTSEDESHMQIKEKYPLYFKNSTQQEIASNHHQQVHSNQAKTKTLNTIRMHPYDIQHDMDNSTSQGINHKQLVQQVPGQQIQENKTNLPITLSGTTENIDKQTFQDQPGQQAKQRKIVYVIKKDSTQISGKQEQKQLKLVIKPKFQSSRACITDTEDKQYKPVLSHQLNSNIIQHQNNNIIDSNQVSQFNFNTQLNNQNTGHNVTRFESTIVNNESLNQTRVTQQPSNRQPHSETHQQNQAASHYTEPQDCQPDRATLQKDLQNGSSPKSQEQIIESNNPAQRGLPVNFNQGKLSQTGGSTLPELGPSQSEKQNCDRKGINLVGCLDSKFEEGRTPDQGLQQIIANQPEATLLNKADQQIINQSQILQINANINNHSNSSIQQQTQQSKSNQNLTQEHKIMEFKQTETTHKQGQSSNVPQQKDDEFCHPDQIKQPKKQLGQVYDPLAQQVPLQPDRKHQVSRSHHHQQYRQHDNLEKSFYMEDFCPQINTCNQQGQNLIFDEAGKQQQFIAGSRQHPIQNSGPSVNLNQDGLQNTNLQGNGTNMGESLNHQIAQEANALNFSSGLQHKNAPLAQAGTAGGEPQVLPQLKNFNDNFKFQRLQHYVGMKNFQKMQSSITGQQEKNKSKDSRQSNKSKVSKQSDRSPRSRQRFQSQRKQFKSSGSRSDDEQQVDLHLASSGVQYSEQLAVQNYFQKNLGLDPAKHPEANQVIQQLLSQKVNLGNLQPQAEIKAEAEPQLPLKDQQTQEQQANILKLDSNEQKEAQRNMPVMMNTCPPPVQKMQLVDQQNWIPKCDLNSINQEQLTNDVAPQPPSKQNLKSLIANQIKKKADELNQFQNAYTMLLSDSSQSQDEQAKQNQFNQAKALLAENRANHQLMQSILNQINNNQSHIQNDVRSQASPIYQFNNNQKPIANAQGPYGGPKPQQLLMQQQYKEPTNQLPAGAPSSSSVQHDNHQISEKEMKLIDELINNDSQLLNNPAITDNLPQTIQVYLVEKLQEKLLSTQQQQRITIQSLQQKGQEVQQAQQNHQVVTNGNNGKSLSSQNENGSNDNNGSGYTKGVNGFTSTDQSNTRFIDEAKLQSYIQNYEEIHGEQGNNNNHISFTQGSNGNIISNSAMPNQANNKPTNHQLNVQQQIANANNQAMRFNGPTSSSAQASGASGDDINSKSGNQNSGKDCTETQVAKANDTNDGIDHAALLENLMKFLKTQGNENPLHLIGQLQTLLKNELNNNQKQIAGHVSSSAQQEKVQEGLIAQTTQQCKSMVASNRDEHESNTLLGKRQEMEIQNDNTISYSDGQQPNNTVSIPIIERVAASASEHSKNILRQQPQPVFKIQNMSGSEKNKSNNEQNISLQQKEYNPYELEDNDTPMQIRLRNQIRQNQSIDQFREVKRELVNSIKVNELDQMRIIIEAKPKRSHQNMGGERFRGSKYRGVSKNKNKWQMMIMINQKKVYVGAIQNEIDAAKFYDHIAIISQGLSAKTNFNYNVSQLNQIIKDYDIDCDSYNTGSGTSGLSKKPLDNLMFQTSQPSYIQNMQMKMHDEVDKKVALNDMDVSKSSDDDRYITLLDNQYQQKQQDRQPLQHEPKVAQQDSLVQQLSQISPQAFNNLNPAQIQKIQQLSQLLDINRVVAKSNNLESIKMLFGGKSGASASTEAMSASLKDSQVNTQPPSLQSFPKANQLQSALQTQLAQILPTNPSQQKLHQIQQQVQSQNLIQNQQQQQQPLQIGPQQHLVKNKLHEGYQEVQQNMQEAVFQEQQATERPINNYCIQSVPDSKCQLLRVLQQSQERINNFTNDHWQNLVKYVSSKNESLQQPQIESVGALNNLQRIESQNNQAPLQGSAPFAQQPPTLIQIPISKVENNTAQPMVQQLDAQQMQWIQQLQQARAVIGKQHTEPFQNKRMEKMVLKQLSQFNAQSMPRIEQVKDEAKQTKAQKINHQNY